MLVSLIYQVLPNWLKKDNSVKALANAIKKEFTEGQGEVARIKVRNVQTYRQLLWTNLRTNARKRTPRERKRMLWGTGCRTPRSARGSADPVSLHLLGHGPRCEQRHPPRRNISWEEGSEEEEAGENKLLCLHNMLIATNVTIELFHFCN